MAKQKTVLFCADCEGTQEQIERILEVIERQKIDLTFFFVGETAEEHKDLVRYIAGKYQVESHTYSHVNLRTLTKEEQHYEIMKGKEAVENIIGKKTHGFRAPMHCLNKLTVEILNKEGFIFDASNLYFHYNMRNVIEIHPTWFREWTEFYEFLRLKPKTAWKIVKLLFRLFKRPVLPVHPHYSGRSKRFQEAFEDFLIFARERNARFLNIRTYLEEQRRWPTGKSTQDPG